MGLIKGRHSLDISRPLSGNQQPLQILRITCGLTAYLIRHNDTPLTATNPTETLLNCLFRIAERVGGHMVTNLTERCEDAGRSNGPPTPETGGRRRRGGCI